MRTIVDCCEWSGYPTVERKLLCGTFLFEAWKFPACAVSRNRSTNLTCLSTMKGETRRKISSVGPKQDQSGSQRNALIVYRNCAVFILINIFELTQTIVLVIILTRPVKIATTYDHRPFVPKTDDLFPRRRFSRTRIIWISYDRSMEWLFLQSLCSRLFLIKVEAKGKSSICSSRAWISYIVTFFPAQTRKKQFGDFIIWPKAKSLIWCVSELWKAIERLKTRFRPRCVYKRARNQRTLTSLKNTAKDKFKT